MEVSEAKLCRLAAAFAISNMGQTVPERITEGPFEESRFRSPRSEICNYAGHLMETDEHEDMFAAEAEMWYKDLKKHSNEEILRIHGQHCPWIQKIIDA